MFDILQSVSSRSSFSLFGLSMHMAVGNESAYSWLVPTSEVTVVVVADCVGTSCVVFR